MIVGGEVPSTAPHGRGRTRTRLARLWGLPLWAHAAALVAVVVAVFPLMTPEGSFTSDEGAYALQVEALDEGGWAYDYRAAEHDPEGRFFPLVLTDELDGRHYLYAKHPVYPLMLRGLSAAFGTVLGLHLLALSGALGTAVAAWLLAGELDGRLSRPAFWLAAASPALVNGYLIWAHAPSAALAGFALVAAVRTPRHGPRWATVGALTALLAAGVLLRSEGLLFAGAVVAALAWALRARVGTVRAAAVAAATAVPVVATAWLEERWIRSIVGGSASGIAVRGERTSYLEGRVRGAWHELVSGMVFGDDLSFLLLIVGMAVLAGFGWAALRRPRPTWAQDVAVACAVAAVAYAARFVLRPHDPVTGLFGAWPVALLGLVLVPWRRAGREVGMLGLAGALFALAIVATQYPQGGGLEWGGRFFSPVVALLAVLAAYGLREAIDRARQAQEAPARLVAGALAAVTAVTAAAGLATVGAVKAREHRLAAAVARHPAEVTVTTVSSLPRSGWHFDDDITWMLVDHDDLAPLLARLKADGVRTVAVLTSADTRLADLSPYARLDPAAEPDVADRGGQLVLLSG